MAVIKVAGYCRVSTDKDDQANSFESQQQYFREYIRHHPEWDLYDIYADEGITGTSTKKRTQFNRMISDAYDGKFHLILTKEVSRFSRNILDTISYTRELKAIGVGVQFMIDGINTLKPDAELYLSIMASLAQEESRKTSARVVWGQTRQMEKGVVFGQSLLGYDVKDGKLTVNPEGAEVVQLIFRKYGVEQVGTSEIAHFLTREGYSTRRGGTQWKSSTVIKILKNEKYAGDLIQKKSYTPDYLTHEKRKNDGDVPLICIENHHEPIISREIWNLTQMRLRKNNKHTKGNSGHSNRYILSGKIRCGECGASFVGRYQYLSDGTKIRRWCCGSAVRGGQDACCVGKLLRDDDAMLMLKTAIYSLPIDTEAIARKVAIFALEARQETSDDQNQIQNEMNRIRQKKEAMLDSYFSGCIFKEEMQSLKLRYDQQLHTLGQRMKHENSAGEALENSMMSEAVSILKGEIWSDIFCKTVLESITVFKDRHMELKLSHLPHVFRFIE